MIREGFIEANGLRFGFIECGEGPLILCLHGFPDTADTWRELMPELASAGYRVVAPCMRGYAPTQIPARPDYSVETLGHDALALIRALGAESATLIGHDWGALAAYAAANLEPECVDRLVTLAIPHPRAIRVGPSFFRIAWHIAFFQLRPVALKALRKDNFALIDRIYRQWSPNWKLPADELRPVKEAFSRPGGLEAALGYYWQLATDLANPLKLPIRRRLRAKTNVPTLTLAGDMDGALPGKYFERAGTAFVGSYRCVRFPGAGHFVHREQPKRVIEEILGFLQEPDSGA